MVIPMNWVAAGLAAATSLHALPAAARDHRMPSSSLASWQAEAQASLQRALIVPHPLGRPSEPAGVVDIRFSVGADGRATRVSVLHPSGHHVLDGLAQSAVRRIRTRSAAPPEVAAGRMIVARIFIAPGDRPLAASDIREMVARTAAQEGWVALDRLAEPESGAMILAGGF